MHTYILFILYKLFRKLLSCLNWEELVFLMPTSCGTQRERERERERERHTHTHTHTHTYIYIKQNHSFHAVLLRLY